MCLYVDQVKTALEKKDTNDRLFFKAFIRDGNHLRTPYMKYSVLVPGIQKAPFSKVLQTKGIVNDGVFHARTTKEALKADLFWIDQFELGFTVIMEIKVKAEDIVAFGNQDNVAVKKYEITKEAWKEAFKRKTSFTIKDLV